MPRFGQTMLSGALALSLVMGAAACLTLSGCGGSEETATGTQGQMSSELQKNLEQSANAAQENAAAAKKK